MSTMTRFIPIADADGVTVVPLHRIEATIEAYHQLKAKEARALAALDAGGTLADIYGVPEISKV